MWPFNAKTEKRSYTDAFVNALLSRATETDRSVALETGAVEICAGLYQRAFQSATVTPMNNRTMALTPELMGSIGRELVRQGEAIFYIEILDSQIALTPAASYDVRGDARPETWRYRLDLFGPSRTRSVRTPHEGVIHCMYAREPGRPYRGVSPMDYARHTGKLAANLENKLSQEANSPVGTILPIPKDPGASGGDGDPLADLKINLGNMKGKLSLVETTSGGWGDRASAPKNDWMPQRIGADTPAAMVQLRKDANNTVAQACGVPAVLLDSAANSAALREGWRVFLHGSLSSLGNSVAHELSKKLGTTVSIDWGRLFASDIASRSRAYKQFRDAGMEDKGARHFAGLED